MKQQQGFQSDFGFDALSAPEACPPAADGGCLAAWQPARWPVAPDWQDLVDAFMASPEGLGLARFITQRLAQGARIHPAEPLRALALTALADTRVVILGQDPYHGAGQAEGLAFSVRPGVPLPPSLRNLFQEIARDPGLRGRGGAPGRRDGSLLAWARQGVLLLNTCLTVEEGRPASHAGKGWEALTDRVIAAVAARAQPAVFLLWGAHAQSRRAVIAAGDPAGRHLVLLANHPSPLSASRGPLPFLGCGHFGQANAFLTRHAAAAVDW